MDIHFINIGMGNMTLLVFPNGLTYLYDCNITDDNEDDVLAYLSRILDDGGTIDVFLCSHRDADHIRGIRTIHEHFPIGKIGDAGVPGTTTDCWEYEEYMKLRAKLPYSTISPRTYQEVGGAVIRFMNGKNPGMPDANDQSVVLKVEYKTTSVLLAGDTSFRPWKEKILPSYCHAKLKADILLAAHHGSLTFFDDPSDERYYYTTHLEAIRPAMTLISVGPNNHDLPATKAVELYTKYSSGSNKGNKVYRTDRQGTMKVVLKDAGGWSLSIDQR